MSTLVNIIVRNKSLIVNRKEENSTFYYYSDNSREVFLSERVYGVRGEKMVKRDFVPEEEKEVYKRICNKKASSSLRRLVKENDLRFHWVLTYSEAGKEREAVSKDFERFIERLRYYCPELKYVAVIELQKKREIKHKEKALHFHLAVDKRIKFKLMSEVWGYGFVLVKHHKEKNAGVVASYLAKYFEKQIDSDGIRKFKQKRYFCSKGLLSPVKMSMFLDDSQKEDLIKEAKEKKAYTKEIFLEGGLKVGCFLAFEGGD